jgi:hypothetical protein
MPDFRKKPVVISAIKWTGENSDEISAWLTDANRRDVVINKLQGKIHIVTLEGPINASVGDWLIRGVVGEIYPCRADIFAATYEAV